MCVCMAVHGCVHMCTCVQHAACPVQGYAQGCVRMCVEVCICVQGCGVLVCVHAWGMRRACVQIHGSECVLVHSGTLACSHVCVHVGAYAWWKKLQMEGLSDLGTFHQGLIAESSGPIFTALAL